MSLRDIMSKTLSEWMKGTGPESDIVVGSRVRLARNLEGIPFPQVASEEQQSTVLETVEKAVKAGKGDGVGHLEFIRLGAISPLERQLLVERHLVSPQHAQNPRNRAVVLRGDEAVSVMVNEEDHLRIQTLFPGLQLMEAWSLCNRVDDFFEAGIDYAVSERRGYLTACPTNVGTGMRVSCMFHLPGLAMTDQVQTVMGAVAKFGLAVRGLYGEGTEVLGNLYQLSNQITLGHSEQEVIKHLENVAAQVIVQERNARGHILETARLQVEDRVWRSYGLLANARLLTSHEAMQMLSDVRLGIDAGLIKGLPSRILQELLVMIRPAHLQKIMGRELGAPERDLHRATLVRERIRISESGKRSPRGGEV